MPLGTQAAIWNSPQEEASGLIALSAWLCASRCGLALSNNNAKINFSIFSIVTALLDIGFNVADLTLKANVQGPRSSLLPFCNICYRYPSTHISGIISNINNRKNAKVLL
jgi:hypothetical protein